MTSNNNHRDNDVDKTVQVRSDMIKSHDMIELIRLCNQFDLNLKHILSQKVKYKNISTKLSLHLFKFNEYDELTRYSCRELQCQHCPFFNPAGEGFQNSNMSWHSPGDCVIEKKWFEFNSEDAKIPHEKDIKNLKNIFCKIKSTY